MREERRMGDSRETIERRWRDDRESTEDTVGVSCWGVEERGSWRETTVRGQMKTRRVDSRRHEEEEGSGGRRGRLPASE